MARNRKRTTAATLERRLNAKSEERQSAWANGGQGELVAAQTRKLRSDFADLRLARSGPAENDFWAPSKSYVDGRRAGFTRWTGLGENAACRGR